jgi:hypothetical protein
MTPDKIRELYQKYFRQGEGKEYTIRGELVYAHHVVIKEETCPGNRLPVSFGKCTGNFDISRAYLTTLVGSPQQVEHNFQCNHNPLTSLEGGPEHVGGFYGCEGNELNLMTLDGLPTYIHGTFFLSIQLHTPSLRLVPQKCRSLTLSGFELIDHVDEILFKCRVSYRNGEPLKKVLWDCQQELTDRGFEGNARW